MIRLVTAPLIFLITLGLIITVITVRKPEQENVYPDFQNFVGLIKEVKRGDDYLVNWPGMKNYLSESEYYELNAPIYLPTDKIDVFLQENPSISKDSIISTIPKKVYRILVISDVDLSGNIFLGFRKIDVRETDNIKLVIFQKL